MDDGAFDADLERFVLAFAHDHQVDVGSRFAAHEFDGIIQAHAFDRGSIQTDDEVASLQTGLLCGGVVNRGNDLDEAVFHADFNAQTAKFATGTNLQFLEFVFIQIGRVRIKAVEHPTDGVGHQILVLGFFHVTFLDAGIDLGKLLQLIQRRRAFDGLLESEDIQADAGGNANQDASHSANQNAVTCMHIIYLSGIFRLPASLSTECACFRAHKQPKCITVWRKCTLLLQQ